MINFNKRNVSFISVLITFIVYFFINKLFFSNELINKEKDRIDEQLLQTVTRSLEVGLSEKLLENNKANKNEKNNIKSENKGGKK